MVKNRGFTLIELLIFIIVLGIVVGTIISATGFALRKTPTQHGQTLASATASQCMEYLLGQRYENGFNFNGQNCPGGADDTSVPTFCNTSTPPGYNTTVLIKCARARAGGSKLFKSIEVTTSGQGGVTYKQLVSNY